MFPQDGTQLSFMLQSALKYQRVFGSLYLLDENYKLCPSLEKWKREEKICTFLMPFYDITTLIPASSYPTSNLYFLQVWNIQTLLMESINDEDEVITSADLIIYLALYDGTEAYKEAVAIL